MTPQSNFMIVAQVIPVRESDLRRLLATMNVAPGRLDINNPLIPFAKLENLHFARWIIVEDQTTGDSRLYHQPPEEYPLCLAFVGDFDGEREAFFGSLIHHASDGLRQIFAHCKGFTETTDLLPWMVQHNVESAANYVNWRGRTVQIIREEAALAAAIQSHLQVHQIELCTLAPAQFRVQLQDFVRAEQSAGRMILSAEPATPIKWRIRNAINFIGGLLLVVLGWPILLPVVLAFLVRVRCQEKSDPEYCPRVEPNHSHALAELEDHDVTNQFTAMGSLKPLFVRRWTTVFVLQIIDWGARHIFNRGRLARVRSIHAARWVFLNSKKRVIFLSNYDGSLESYMDDFVNKVGFGLNVSFSNGIGYPATRWLVFEGCADERLFKEYLRRHQLPTQVWYHAYPGLTAADLERNMRVRQGLQSPSLSDQELQNWMALL